MFKNLKIDEFKKFHPEFDEDVFVDLEPLNVVKSRTSEGGTGFTQVEKEIKNWQKNYHFESQLFFYNKGML